MRLLLLALSLVFMSGCASSEDVPPEGPLGPGVKPKPGVIGVAEAKVRKQAAARARRSPA